MRRVPQVRPAFVIGAGLLLLIAAAPSLIGGRSPMASSAPEPHLADSHTPGDHALYAAVTARVAAGSSYYPAVVQLHRERGYPLRPFVTVRPPTLAVVSALLGRTGTLAFALVLIAANAIAWYARLRTEGPFLRFGALAGASALGAAGISPEVLVMHEWWSGLLLSLALALDVDRRFGAALACATAAALVRELAVVFLILLLAVELQRRCWCRVAIVVATLLVLAALLAGHGAAVAALTTPSDMASPGWLGLRGIAGFAHDFAVLLNLEWLPGPLASLVAIVPLGGWLAASRNLGKFPLAWFSAFALFEGFLDRPDNYYWAQLVMPAYPLGWLLMIARLPRLLTEHRGKSSMTGGRQTEVAN